MNFLPKDLCDKALAIGCKSESNFHWFKRSLLGCEETTSWMNYPHHGDPTRIPTCRDSVAAFCFEDFAGTTEENAILLFGLDYVCDDGKTHGCPTCGIFHFQINIEKHKFYRAKMMHSKDWIEFIRPHIEKAYEERMGK